MPLIYIVEDDMPLQAELAKLLEFNGYEVVACKDFLDVPNEVATLSPDLVILDLNLPGTDGQSICRDIRQSSSSAKEASAGSGHQAPDAHSKAQESDSSDVPIIILTSSNDEFTEVMSLNLGAHDFITKPYRPAVLLARIASLIKRHNASASNGSVIEYAGVALDTASSKVSFDGKEELVTRNEQHILALLMKNPETIISRQELMCDLWESDAFIDDNTLTVNVNRLRKTLSSIGVPPDFLQTRRSQGYMVTSEM